MRIKEKLSKFFERIRINKKLQIVLIFSVLAVILVCYLAYSEIKLQSKKQSDLNATSGSAEEYVISLEKKLENVLSNIDGAGRVSVAITVSTGFAKEYAYEETNKESLSGNSSTSTLILVDNEPVVVFETYPKISGVLVIAEGGNKIGVKLGILQSIQTLLDVTNDNITILEGKF